MDPDKELEISLDRTKKEVQERTRTKKKSVLKGSARKKQTEDRMYIDRMQTEAQGQHPREVVADIENQSKLTETLRKRVRRKLKTVKVEFSKSLKGSSSFPHRLECLRKKELSTKYGKPAAQEEKSADKHQSDTKEYENDLEGSTENQVSMDEGFKFFTSTFEEDLQLEETDQGIDQKSINDSLQNVYVLNEQAPLLDHVREMLLPELLEIKPPEYECRNMDKKKQLEQLFVPSTSPVVHSCKLPNNMLPRFLEDEGFYIPRKPSVSRNTYHKMENRLLQQEGGKSWFEESGEIISLPSPIKQSSHCRMPFPPKIDTQLKTTYRKAMRPELESCIITKSEDQSEIYQLDLNISSIVFSHHSLFNCEQVLAAKLLELYECFQKRQQQNVTHLLSEKLKALISATKLAESNLEASQLSAKTLEDYRSQIRNTKMLHDTERQRDDSLVQSMLKVWKQIKSVRRQQRFISTTVKLQFQKLTKNLLSEEYATKISEETEKKIRQEREECDIDSSNKVSSSWKKQGCLDSTYAFLSSTNFEEMNGPLFMPRLAFTTEITATDLCSLDEQKRREKVQMEKYFIKIYYNNKLVSCTSEAPLQHDFKIIFHQIFRIQVLNWPESLRLEVFESNKNTTLLAKVYLPLPDNFNLKSKDVLEEAEFSCEQQVKPSDGAVGSNVLFFLDENEKEELCLLISGKLIYSLSWAADDRGIPLAPTVQHAHFACNSVSRIMDARKGTGIWLHSDIQKLIDRAKEVNIDPNDPDYSDLVELIMYAKFQEQSDSKYFRLEQLQEEFNFVTEEEIKNCKRFQLLQLRSLGQLGFYCFQQIPLHDREIPDSIFQKYEGQVEKDVLVSDVDPISAQRNSSASFIRKMRQLVMKRIMTIRHKFNLSDIVNDYEEIISMSQLSNAVFKLGERRRHLKPQRKERRKVPAQAVSDGDVKLLVRILRAYNIPARKAAAAKLGVVRSPSLNRLSRGRHLLSGKSAYTTDPLSEVAVHPFVEVSFQNTVYQTSTADGSHPCWNEELQVDFSSRGHEYTFSGLSKIKDYIYINIFDEFVTEKHEDTCLKGCSGHSYVRKNWLGSIMFPFSTLLEQSKICGTFQVNMPSVLLGYTWSKTYVPPKEECCGQNLKEYTFLTIFATIEPQLSSAENNLESDKLADHEDEIVLQRACIFKKTCKALFPKRRIITSVFNNEGRNILVTKYITSLNPPQLLLDMYPEDPYSASDLVSRFVSLIPCISDTVDENDEVDVWMTSEHCISLGVGNKEEHAVLLCNYLLYIGKKAWVLLGTSVLEGKVAYVATQENGEYFLWNPLNGQCYKQFDAFCPLQSVDCLISWENVWFNIQQNSSPMCVSFDISKECFWKQLLPYNIQHSKTHTVQPEEIFYVPTDESLVEELQNRIEKTLKNKMMEWRSRQPTRWNRQCISVLRQILPKLEFRNGSSTIEKEETDMEPILEHYWPLMKLLVKQLLIPGGCRVVFPWCDLSSIISHYQSSQSMLFAFFE
ncbi:protein CC2D2B isoform X3 [Hemicordylus capensis]|uniref:protein CC2D2B isoform X3 n=1 Tax=Hemicordylus capensis TaxID=884348 RepID=UPI0023047B8D|nr:protein CC2D2B isoform X3 [Hemicordylus capensis]